MKRKKSKRRKLWNPRKMRQSNLKLRKDAIQSLKLLSSINYKRSNIIRLAANKQYQVKISKQIIQIIMKNLINFQNKVNLQPFYQTKDQPTKVKNAIHKITKNEKIKLITK